MSSTMAHKVVLRLAKLKSFGNVAASLSTYRTRETPNAATELADQNTHSHSNPAGGHAGPERPSPREAAVMPSSGWNTW